MGWVNRATTLTASGARVTGGRVSPATTPTATTALSKEPVNTEACKPAATASSVTSGDPPVMTTASLATSLATTVAGAAGARDASANKLGAGLEALRDATTIPSKAP